jgi:hypothetical protein
MREIRGSCHCGNIHFILEWPDTGPTIPVRACGCSFCRKHGGVWTSNPGGRFRLQLADDFRVTRYRFGTESADFHVCADCGVTPIVTCVIDGARFAVVNANVFDNVDKTELAVAAANFEGESMDGRLVRRRRNWTPEALD